MVFFDKRVICTNTDTSYFTFVNKILIDIVQKYESVHNG